MLETLIPLFISKSAEIIFGLVLEKFWKWLLNDSHTQCASNFLKMQILIFYLDLLVRQKSFKYLPANYDQIHIHTDINGNKFIQKSS